MTAPISFTQSNLLTALGGFLLPLVQGEAITAQSNRVPMPLGDCCVMTPLYFTGLATGYTRYSADGTAEQGRAMRWDVQLDFYGPSAPENALRIATVFRSPSTCEAFMVLGGNMQPLFAKEPRQRVFVNAQQQYETCWSLDIALQCQPIVHSPVDMADQLAIGLKEVDVTFPPET